MHNAPAFIGAVTDSRPHTNASKAPAITVADNETNLAIVLAACPIELLRVGNGLLSRLDLIPNTGALLQITTFSGQLDQLLVGLYTDKSSVWVQEDFSGKGSE